MQRKIYLLVILLITTFITTKVIAQTTGPDGVIFQAVATDPQGNPAANRTIYIKDAILQTTATGTVVYSETFQVTASSTGVFTIVIGKGQRLSGPTSIASLDWSAGPYFLNLKAAVAPSLPLANWNADQQYVDMGTSQFWTVPFSLFASKVAGFDLKMNIVDTANMLKPYMKKSDTATLSARIDATKLAVTQETTRATAAEALKANITDVTASLALKANINNPTFTGTVGGITKSMVGLANADNTSDINKPISTAMQTALDLKANTTDVTSSLALKANINNPTFTGAVGGITKSMVGLNNVDNTSDINKPVSTATQTVLDFKANSSDVTIGLALKAPIDNPTFTGTVAGIDKTMVGLSNADNTSDANKPISTATQTALDLKVNTTEAITSLALKANIASPNFTGIVSGITKSMVGLSNVNNTTDLLKPISTATQTALDLKSNSTDVTTSLALKANLASPTFTGTVSGISKLMVGLGNADNTTDLLKPISTATQTALDLKVNTTDAITSIALKEDLTNKSTTTTLGTSDVLYPTQKAVKTYVDAQVATAAISIGVIGSSNAKGASITSGVLNLAPADGTNGGIVTTGTQTFAGAKTFSGEVIGGNTTTSKISGFAANMNTQTGTTYQLTTGDNGKIITLNNSAGITLTVPTLFTGFNCMIVQLGSGIVTLTTSGTTISNRSNFTRTAGTNAIVTIIALSNTTFISAGDMQ